MQTFGDMKMKKVHLLTTITILQYAHPLDIDTIAEYIHRQHGYITYWVVKSLAKVLFAQGVHSLGKPKYTFKAFCFPTTLEPIYNIV